jgi:O-antigen/teichoic acid export membrane protein
VISKKFIRSSFIYTLAGTLPMASAVILLPFYIRYLPMEVYGAFSVCLALSMLVQILVTYSLDTTLYVHYHEFKSEPQKLSAFISSSFIFILGLGVVVLLVFSLIGNLAFKLFSVDSDFSFYPYGLMSVGLGALQAVFRVHNNLLQIREKAEVYLISNVVTFVLIAVTTIVGLQMFPQTLAGPLGGRVITALIMGLWVLVRIFREFGVHMQSPWRYVSFSFNVYTFIYQVQQWTINYVDRFLILLFLPSSSTGASLSMVGVYDFALKCLVPIELILNGLNATINPQVVKIISSQVVKQATVEINRYFYGLVAVMMIMICVTVFAVPVGIDWFVSATRYGEALQYLPYLAVLFVFRAVRLYFVVPYSVLKQMRPLTLLNFVVAVLKIALMIWLVRIWYIEGIIMSAALAFMFELVLLRKFLLPYYQIQFNAFKLMIAPFLILLMIVCAEPWIPAGYGWLAHGVYAVVCALVLAVAYRNEWQHIPFMKAIIKK